MTMQSYSIQTSNLMNLNHVNLGREEETSHFLILELKLITKICLLDEFFGVFLKHSL